MTILTYWRPAMTSLNVAEAKKHFSDLLARVAFGGESVLITRRGKPMAKLIPAEVPETSYLDSVEGWLDDDDPFFATIDDIVARRFGHEPRVLQGRDRGEEPGASGA
jgi:prevent-host-death family protein